MIGGTPEMPGDHGALDKFSRFDAIIPISMLGFRGLCVTQHPIRGAHHGVESQEHHTGKVSRPSR
ncbi:MAG: hypothetical protein M0C28_15940 [Candidatus Moduliflexus flocculans]|nr:hypothetical protein [Candidatus Moduliflexus flocculans]